MARTVLFVTFLLVLAGCASLASLGELRKDIEAAGYEVVGIHHNTTNGHSVLTIEAVMPNEIPTDEDADDIAEIAWKQYSGEIDELQVAINAQPMLAADVDELSARYGARPNQSAGESGSGGGNATVIILIVVGVAIVFAGLMVLLWRRGLRRRPMVTPTYQYPPPPVAAPYQYPPTPGPAPPPYSRPASGGTPAAGNEPPSASTTRTPPPPPDS